MTRLADARIQTDRLFNLLRPASIYQRPIPERHRTVFYIGHLEAFDWNLLRPHLTNGRPFHPEFDQLFAFGIDPVNGGLPSDKPSDWPTLAEVYNYQRRIRDAIDVALITHSGLSTLLNVAIEHRLMHAETLAYMLHQLPFSEKMPLPNARVRLTGPVVPRMITIPDGAAALGLSRDDPEAFGWDNEYEAHRVPIPAFEIDQYKVTNGQFLQFIKAGGYQNQALWAAADWLWKAEQDITQPVFWNLQGNAWYLRTMFDEVPLPLEWPVYVSHAEASAYARWVNKSLPTESQWHRAAYGSPDATDRPYPWGAEVPSPHHGYFDCERWDPSPVNAFPQARSECGVEGLLANGWEWTSSVFGPFDGFRPFPFYPGYSANFFDGKHYVMKGGSTRTAGCMLRCSFRNWFQPHYQYAYAGFRCVSE